MDGDGDDAREGTRDEVDVWRKSESSWVQERLLERGYMGGVGGAVRG